MKAIVVREFGGPEVLTLADAADPSPGAGQVVVRVHAIGVNPVDAYIRSGTYPRKPALPYTPGTDFAGIVDAVGSGVTRVAAGDRVYGHGLASSGAYAELVLTPETGVDLMPDDVSFDQGAAIGVPYVTAWRALFAKAHARAGETVLIHGASGGVGVAAVQIARAAGLHVLGTAGSDRGLDLVASQGAHHVSNHHEEGYLDALRAATGGRGVDVVLEMLANVNLDRALDLLATFGRLVIVGSRGRVEIDPRKIMGRDATVVGMTMFNASANDQLEAYAAISAGLEAGTLVPVIGKEFTLAGAADAHIEVLKPSAYGKIVLHP